MRKSMIIFKILPALFLALVSKHEALAAAGQSGIPGDLSAYQLTLTNFEYIPVSAHTVCFSWTTSQEFDVEKFELQASQDSLQFITIDDAAATNYRFGHTYYSSVISTDQYKFFRLIMVNENGQTEMSNTIHLVSTSLTKQDITIYPNPITGLAFNIKVPTLNPVGVNVYTREGVLVFNTRLQGQFGYRISLPSKVNNAMNLVVQVTINDKTQSFNVLNKE